LGCAAIGSLIASAINDLRRQKRLQLTSHVRDARTRCGRGLG
jgi:hypothetical protein